MGDNKFKQGLSYRGWCNTLKTAGVQAQRQEYYIILYIWSILYIHD